MVFGKNNLGRFIYYKFCIKVANRNIFVPNKFYPGIIVSICVLIHLLYYFVDYFQFIEDVLDLYRLNSEIT